MMGVPLAVVDTEVGEGPSRVRRARRSGVAESPSERIVCECL